MKPLVTRGNVVVDAPRPELLTAAHTLSGRGASKAAFPRGAWERSLSPARSADKNLSSVFCPPPSERGISLIELIMFIVIVSVALAGVMLVMNTTTKYSADPLIHKQVLTVAESLLEEVELKYFAVTTNAAGRQNFNDIFDYNALNPASATYANSSVAVSGLEGYSVAVVVVSGVILTGVLAASAAQITVTVTEPGGQAIEVTGYKVAY